MSDKTITIELPHIYESISTSYVKQLIVSQREDFNLEKLDLPRGVYSTDLEKKLEKTLPNIYPQEKFAFNTTKEPTKIFVPKDSPVRAKDIVARIRLVFPDFNIRTTNVEINAKKSNFTFSSFSGKTFSSEGHTVFILSGQKHSSGYELGRFDGVLYKYGGPAHLCGLSCEINFGDEPDLAVICGGQKIQFVPTENKKLLSLIDKQIEKNRAQLYKGLDK